MGKAVEHLFEKEDGEKNEWRGMVLSRAPVMTNWYYITYEKDPVLYMYQLWDDYADGDLRILPEAGTVNLCFKSGFIQKEFYVVSSSRRQIREEEHQVVLLFLFTQNDLSPLFPV